MRTICFFTILLFMLGCKESRREEAQAGEGRVIHAEGRPNFLLMIADDMSWLHTGYSGCRAVSTPGIDYLAKNGVWFSNAYCSAPSCTASRGALLTGRNGWELQEGACLWSVLPARFKTYTEYLEEAGYHAGYTGKGWGPGDWKAGGREQNPAGKAYNEISKQPFPEFGDNVPVSPIDYAANFEKFLSEKPSDRPFCFFLGTSEPHRAYLEGIGRRLGKDPEDVKVPGFLPDVPEVRNDILDYLAEVEWFDAHVGRAVDILRKAGELDNTLIIVTSDNGMPFPRAKSNLYEYGTHMPFVVYWKGLVPGGRVVDDLVSLVDVAPTFMEAAGLPVPGEMTGRSLLDLFSSGVSGTVDPDRNRVFTFRERHAWVQPEGRIYPMRAMRKGDYLLIWNQEPGMWPAGHVDPKYNYGNSPFGDVDEGPTKEFLLGLQSSEDMGWYYNAAFARRPEYELYHITDDPFQLVNLAGSGDRQDLLEEMKRELSGYLKKTGDLRQTGRQDLYYQAPYSGRIMTGR